MEPNTILEKQIIQSAQNAVAEAIHQTLTKYDSPLVALTKQVVIDHSAELKQMITDAFQTVIRTEDFKASIVSAFSHKVARTIISNNDGMFEKVSNDLKQDHVFKAKMSLAVANVVEECLKDKK